jgi:hypothetical protein
VAHVPAVDLDAGLRARRGAVGSGPERGTGAAQRAWPPSPPASERRLDAHQHVDAVGDVAVEPVDLEFEDRAAPRDDERAVQMPHLGQRPAARVHGHVVALEAHGGRLRLCRVELLPLLVALGLAHSSQSKEVWPIESSCGVEPSRWEGGGCGP